MIDLRTFLLLAAALRKAGHGDDVEWAEHCRPPDCALAFASESIFVICNSGMRNTVARNIYSRVMDALAHGRGAIVAFGHIGKVDAIDDIWKNRDQYFAEYLAAPDKLAYCETLPWIGQITKYHLAKNFGLQFAKPDVHLQRLADRERCTPQALCERLAHESGYKVATVDVILWRACAIGLLESRTGRLSGRAA